jgi:flagellar biosynthesis/type III secretory pathway ATPase
MNRLVRQFRRVAAQEVATHLSEDHHDPMTGVVTAVDTVTFRADVQLRGATTATKAIPYVTSYTPTVNAKVYVIGSGRSMILIGPAPLV